MSTFDYKLLRTKTVADGNDADFVGTQAAPADLVTAERASSQKDVAAPVQVEFVGVWTTDASVIVAGVGSFTVTVIRVLEVPALSATEIVTDSVTLATQGERPFLVDDVRSGDKLGLRVTGMTAPGAATKLKLFYRVAPEVG